MLLPVWRRQMQNPIITEIRTPGGSHDYDAGNVTHGIIIGVIIGTMLWTVLFVALWIAF